MCWISIHATILMPMCSRMTLDNTDNLWSWFCVLPQVAWWGKGNIYVFMVTLDALCPLFTNDADSFRLCIIMRVVTDLKMKVIVLWFVICEKTTISLTHQAFSIHSKQPCSQFQLLRVRPDCPLAISRLFTNHKSQNSKTPPPSPFLPHVRKD